MATLDNIFDPSKVEPSNNSFEPVTAGTYIGEVVSSDVRLTKAGTGKYVFLDFKITEGEHEGRHIFTNINYVNSNPTAQNIGQQQLAALCAAVGLKGALEDTTDLHDTPIQAKIVIENDRTGQYGPRNTIRGFMPLTARAGNPAVAQARPAAAAASGAGKAPWQK